MSKIYETWSKYDERGNCINFKDSDGLECQYKYDENGNEIHFKSDSIEFWKEYDEKGNVIFFKDSHGYEEKTKYDEQNRVISVDCNNGLFERYEYGEGYVYSRNKYHVDPVRGEETEIIESWRYDRENEIYYKNNKGYEEWTELNENRDIVSFKSTQDGKLKEEEYWNYNSDGEIIQYKNNKGVERNWDYNENGNMIHYIEKDSGFECWYEYDERGNGIHYKNSRNQECWYEYDENNNCIHKKAYNPYTDKINESFYEYDENGNEIYSKSILA